MTAIRWHSTHRDRIGGKACGLLVLQRHAKRLGYVVPPFFVIPTDDRDPEYVWRILAKGMGYRGLFAVRSSSPWEDQQGHSCAGVYKSILNVKANDILDAVQEVRKSAVSSEAYAYASARKFTIDDHMAVIVQQMIPGDVAGVVYSTLPSYPLATSLECKLPSQGVYWHATDFDKATLNIIFGSERGLTRDAEDETTMRRVWRFNERSKQNIARVAQELERIAGHPLDIEFTWRADRRSDKGRLYLLQQRWLTDMQQYTDTPLPDIPNEKALLRSAVVRGIGSYEGPLVLLGNIIPSRDDLQEWDSTFSNGYVLCIEHFYDTTESYRNYTQHMRALVTYNSSQRSSHAMTLAREHGVLYMGHGLYHDMEGGQATYNELRQKTNTGDKVRLILNGREGVLHMV